MRFELRVLLIIAAIIMMAWILQRIKKSSLLIGDAIFWICMSFGLVVIGIFPQIIYILSALLGVQTPVHLVFLLIIGCLLEKLFTLSLKVSLLEEKVIIMNAEIAIRSTSSDEENK